jgi:cytochrome c
LISNPTAISIMTGVFHFMAISLDPILARGKVGLRLSAVNQQQRRRNAPLLSAGGAALLCLGPCFGSSLAAQNTDARFAVLVLSKTAGFRHDSIAQGTAAIAALGAEYRFRVDSTEDAAQFNEANLARYRVVVFLNTTGDVLGPGEKAAFERYIRSSGGFVGIHSASDTEYHWPWYGQLVGAYFASHPAIQHAAVHIESPDHPSTKGLPAVWNRTDEWYNFQSNPRGEVRVLATLDGSSYSGGTMDADHPIAWCHAVDRGRSWYTAMGHTKESYAEPLFGLHLLGGIESAAGIAGECPATRPDTP